MPIVYLIQPCELIGTDRYKIGRSSKNDLSRMKGYKAGSRYITIMEVDDDKYVEKNLINHFNNTYTRIAGLEYFQGDEQQMRRDFLDIVINNTHNNQLKSYKLSQHYQQQTQDQNKELLVKNITKSPINVFQKYAYKKYNL